MLSTKIRNSIITVVAASGIAFAVGPLVSDASAAKNIPGRYQKSAEGLKATKAPYPCMSEKLRYNELVNASEEFLREGKTEGAYAAGDAASNVYNKAQKAGCAWAA